MRPPPRAVSCSLSPRTATPRRLVVNLLRKLVPTNAVPDLRPDPPLEALRGLVGQTSERPGLLRRVERRARRGEAAEVGGGDRDDPPEGGVDRPPPPPVPAHHLTE